MIFGIGVDSLRIGRMEKSMQNPRFVQRVFAPQEQAMLAQRTGTKAAGAASCFAAKEAFLKALGKGLGSLPLCEIAALRREGGAPYYSLYGAAAAYCAERGLQAHLSITHEGGVATAFAVVEQADGVQDIPITREEV